MVEKFGTHSAINLPMVPIMFLVRIYLFTALAIVTFSVMPLAFGQSKDGGEPATVLPSGWESYADRPNILDLPIEKNQGLSSSLEGGLATGLGSEWIQIRKAHFAFIAQLFALYPEATHFYFLARDSEHLYDAALLIADSLSDHHHRRDKIHLLNISRANMRDPNAREYLKQNGISEDLLKSGKKVVFVDTGFAGTIPRVIAENFSGQALKNVRTQLIVSSSPNHPSSRVFLSYLNSSINKLNPAQMHGTIVNYEHMPRYTDRASQFLRIGQRLHPISPIDGADDGSVSKAQALLYMKDIKAAWLNEQTRQEFRRLFDEFQAVLHILTLPSKAESIRAAKGYLQFSQDKVLPEAIVRDAIEILSRNLKASQISVLDLGLTVPAATAGFSKKKELVEKFPEWAPYIEDPATHIHNLFLDKNWQLIANLLDANIDAEINQLILFQLFALEPTGVVGSLQTLVVENADEDRLLFLAQRVFAMEKASDKRDLLRKLIEKGKANSAISAALARHVFSKPHSADKVDLARVLIEQDSPAILMAFSMNGLGRVAPLNTRAHRILEKSIFISNVIERRAFLQNELGASGSPDTSSTKKLPSTIHPDLQPGDQLEIKNGTFTVLERSGDGRRGVVFKVRGENQAFYALKVAKDQHPQTLASLQKESEKAKALQSLKIPHAKILVQGSDYVLKPWINGQRGDQVIEALLAGEVSLQPAVKALLELVDRVRKAGAYVGDFRPANVIFNGKSWIVVDSGAVEVGMTLEQAEARWQAKFKTRWQIDLPICDQILN